MRICQQQAHLDLYAAPAVWQRHLHMLCRYKAVFSAGRSETMVEYDVAFKASGEITALKIRGYFLCGAFLDLGFNDMMVLQQGVDQVQPFNAPTVRSLYALLRRLCPDLGGDYTTKILSKGYRLGRSLYLQLQCSEVLQGLNIVAGSFWISTAML